MIHSWGWCLGRAALFPAECWRCMGRLWGATTGCAGWDGRVAAVGWLGIAGKGEAPSGPCRFHRASSTEDLNGLSNRLGCGGAGGGALHAKL
jgi:hypothetical protein